MAISPLDYILKGAKSILEKGEQAFRGDVGALTGNQNINATKTGIALNTVLGLPKATGTVAKDIGQGIARSVGTVGITAGNLPTQLLNTVGGKRQLPTPFPRELPTNENKIGQVLFGGKPVRTLGGQIENVQKITEPYVGKTSSKFISPPLVLGSIALDLSGWGGKAGVKTFAKGEIPEKFFKFVAKTADENILRNTYSKIGVKNPQMLDELVKGTAPLKNIDDVKNFFTSFGQQTQGLKLKGASMADDLAQNVKAIMETGRPAPASPVLPSNLPPQGIDVLNRKSLSEKLPPSTRDVNIMEDYQNAEYQVLADLDTSHAGFREFTEDGVVGVKSTFPKDMPEHLRSKSLFDSATKKIGTNQKLGSRERELADWIERKIISRMQPEFADEVAVNKFLFGLDERIASEENAFLRGLTKDIVDGIRNKRFSIKEYAKGTEKAKKIGEATGKKIGISSQKNAQSIIVEQTKRKGELKLLKEGIKIRDKKDSIIGSLRDVEANASQSRKLVQQLVEENLPISERGKFMTMLRDAKTQKDVAKAFFRVDDKLEEITKKQIISDIKKTVGSLPENVDLDYKNKINEALSGIELTGHNKETTRKLEATQKYLQEQKAQGKDVTLPQRILEKLQILGRTPKEQLTSSQLQGLKDEVEFLKKLGQTKQLTKERLYQAEKDLIADDLASTIKPLNTKDIIRRPGQVLPLATKTTNKVKESLNKLKKARLSLRPIDGIAEITGMEKMKNRIDVDYGNYLNHNQEFIAERQAFLKERPLNKQNMERIGIYALREQDGGYEKLANLSVSEREANNIILTSDEKAYYDLGRKWFESDYEAVKAYMKDVYNKDVGKVKNYVSFQTDFNAMSELEIYERFGTLADDALRRTKTVKKDFTETRTGAGNQKVKIDFDNILLQHKDNVAYMLNIGRDIKMYSEVLNNPKVAEKLGDLGTLVWKEWLDLMARKGGTDGAKQIAILDTLRRNLGVGVMSYKLSSALIQFSSLADSAGTIGGKWTSIGAYDVATSREARQFVLDNFPEIRQMIGDDIAFLELKDSFLGRAGEIGLKPLQKLDGLMRSTTAIGAYKKLAQAKGIPFDMKNPDKGIIAEVTKLTRQSQGSSSFKDTPLAITKGMFTGNKSLDKLIFQFQSFMLNRWENIERQIWREGFGKGNIAHGFMSFFWLILVAGLMEEGLRRGSRKITDTITGNEREEDPLINSLIKNTVNNVPIVGNVMNSLTYDSNPIPVINAGENVLGGLQTTIKGKETATKLKGGVDLGLGLANLGLGVPGTTQIGQVIKPLIKTEDTLSTKAKAKVKPIYDQVQKLKAEGREDEALALANTLTEAEAEVYKSIKSAEKSKQTQALKVKVTPIYNKIQKLKANGQADEALALAQTLTEEEARVYKLIKEADTKRKQLEEVVFQQKQSVKL